MIDTVLRILLPMLAKCKSAYIKVKLEIVIHGLMMLRLSATAQVA